MSQLLAAALTITSAAVADEPGAPTGQAKRLIDHLKMTQIPDEGPWFTVTYVSGDQLPGAALPGRYAGRAHAAGSAIYAVETRRDFSAMHRLRTDETWHFYSGDPLEMLLLYPDGRAESVVIGPDVLAGQHPQFTVPRGVWQGSAPKGNTANAYSFFADQLAPAFDNEDFEIGYRDELQKAYPKYAAEIARLTRPAFATRATAPRLSSAPDSGPGNTWEKAPAVEVSPGMMLRELVGRVAEHKSEAYSVAHIDLAEGQSSASSFNKTAEETFLVVHGHGRVMIDGQSQPVAPGSVVVIPPKAHHALTAEAGENLEFYAISAPAFQPEDFVLDPAK